LAIHLVVHIARDVDCRRLTEVMALQGYDARRDRFEVQHLYTHGSPRR
jgi:hypothetical protein